MDTIARLLEFTSRELLDGRGSNLGADTPLLEFGVLDSLSMVGLLCFIFGEFGFDMSAEVVVSDCFRSLEAISELICGLRSQGEASERAQGEFRKLVKLKEVNGIDSRKTNLENSEARTICRRRGGSPPGVCRRRSAMG